jgi:hypothetical protein
VCAARSWASSDPAHISEAVRSECFVEVRYCVGRGACECFRSDLVIQANVKDCQDLKVRVF